MMKEEPGVPRSVEGSKVEVMSQARQPVLTQGYSKYQKSLPPRFQRQQQASFRRWTVQGDFLGS